MGSLVTAATTAYNEWKTANWPADVAGWNALTTEQKMELWATEQQYKLAIDDATAIESSFYEARSEVFTQFEATKQIEHAALQTLWQSKEDNGFDVDYGEE